jgi:capsular polysaccharide transport system ATP-binding protein
MIAFDNAGKAYRNRKGVISWVLRGFTGAFPPDANMGILATRGQGKSTLIELASGSQAPSEGRIYRQGRISWAYNAKNVISNRLTGRQNIRFLSDVYGQDFSYAYDFAAQFSDLGRYLDAPLRQYNAEMRSRLSISALFAMGFDYILVDEGLEGGDNSFRRKCIEHIEENKDHLKFLFATSNPQLITKYCQFAGILNDGKLTIYDSVDRAVETFGALDQVTV